MFLKPSALPFFFKQGICQKDLKEFKNVSIHDIFKLVPVNTDLITDNFAYRHIIYSLVLL